MQVQEAELRLVQMSIKHSALGMENGKGASLQSPQNAALMGKEQALKNV